jgi:hypothetical protein
MKPTGPLIAYLEALRGERPESSSGPLDNERVVSFGLPYLLPGDESAMDLEVRATKFLTDLRAAVDGLELTPREIATQYFFGSGTARQRQEKAADALLGKSETAPRNLQKQVLASVATRFLELGEVDDGQARAPKQLAATVNAVSPLYPSGADLKQLAAMIVPSRPPIEDADVSLTLRDADDPDLYRLLLTSTTLAHPGCFYLALTSRAPLSDLVVTMCPRVGEVFTCSSEFDVERRAKEWVEGDCEILTAVGKTDRGLSTRPPLALKRAPDEDKAAVLQGLSAADIAATTVLVAEVPGSIADGDFVSIEIALPSEMERQDHYCYWLASRPTFVKKITVKWSELTLPGEQKIGLRSTIRATTYEPRYDDSGCEYRVNGWLVAGQGVLVTW